MAGRILPIALATVFGVAIGVATFDGELKAQRKKRLEEEYQRDVSALNSQGPSPMASSAIKSPAPEQSPAGAEPAQSSKLSSILGFWAWKKSDITNATPKEAPAKPAAEGSK